MGTIRDYIYNLEYVGNTLWQETKEIIDSKKDDIINLNIEQLSDNKKPDNSWIGFYKLKYQKDPYVDKRGFPKDAGQGYNFIWSGTYVNSLFIEKNEDMTIQIFSSDPKRSLLFSKYNETAGLTLKNQRILNDEILYPEILKYINQYL